MKLLFQSSHSQNNYIEERKSTTIIEIEFIIVVQ